DTRGGQRAEIRLNSYRPYWPRSLTCAAFRAATGRTANPHDDRNRTTQFRNDAPECGSRELFRRRETAHCSVRHDTPVARIEPDTNLQTFCHARLLASSRAGNRIAL